MSLLNKSLAAFTLLLFSSLANAANIPEKLLNMPITLLNGEVVTLKQYQGKQPVYLKFWATWCQPCRKQMPHFEHVHQQYGKDMQVIGINLAVSDTLQAVKDTQQEFGLTMPMAMDNNGDLAQAFRLLGTPYHLLFDKQMNLVHIGHESDAVIDNKIALLNRNEPIDLLAKSAIAETAPPTALPLEANKTHAIFFTATWCDWYLKDSRPTTSQNCIKAQKTINALSKRYPNVVWHQVLSRLWTGDKELNSYKKKYQIELPLVLDSANNLFHQYGVRELATLVIVKGNETVFSTSNFSSEEAITNNF